MVPSGSSIGWEFCVLACGALTATGALQVRPWSSDQATACGEPSGLLLNGPNRNGVQNWYSRPRCRLPAAVSTTSQFLSSDTEHVSLRCTSTGGAKVRPPSALRDTATAVSHPVLKIRVDT